MRFPSLNVDIRDVQKVQLEILLEFDRICKKYNITYQLFAGTLLGAVRHDGFIPWDDDVDVCLTREDYNQFLRICEKELNNQYFLQTYETDKNYISQFAKLRKNNTIFIESGTSECDIHHGIFIDIFPLDNILPNSFKGEVQIILLHILYSLNISQVKNLCLGIESVINRYSCLFIHSFAKAIPKNWMDKIQKSVSCLFNNKKTKYITLLTVMYSKNMYKKYMFKRKDFYNTILHEFEGHYFPIPKNYDKVLSNIYGNYNKFPPKNKQNPHHGVIKISFTEGKNWSLNNEKKV